MGFDAVAGHRGDAGGFGKGEAQLFPVSGDGAGQGVVGVGFDREGIPQHIGFAARRKAVNRSHGEVAGGQRARLVEGDDIHFGQLFHGGTATEQHAVARAPGDGREDGRRDREDERARRRHDEKRHRPVESAAGRFRRMDRRQAEAQPPDEEHDRHEAERAQRVTAAEPVGEALAGRLELLRIADEPDDLLQRAFRGRPQDAGIDRAPEIQCARHDAVAGRLLHGRGFPGQVGFIGGGAALRDLGIDGELAVRPDAQRHARREQIDRDLLLGSILLDDQGGFRRSLEERADFALRPAHGVVLHRAGKREQEKQGRSFRPRADRRAAGGHGEHEEVDVENLLPQQLPDFLRRSPRSA